MRSASTPCREARAPSRKAGARLKSTALKKKHTTSCTHGKLIIATEFGAATEHSRGAMDDTPAVGKKKEDKLFACGEKKKNGGKRAARGVHDCSRRAKKMGAKPAPSSTVAVARSCRFVYLPRVQSTNAYHNSCDRRACTDGRRRTGSCRRRVLWVIYSAHTLRDGVYHAGRQCCCCCA